MRPESLPGERGRSRHLLGVFAAFLIAAGTVGWQHRHFADPHVVYDRFSLPGFDAYVYVAMAENPGVFTVAPWGYRLLTPALVGALTGRAVVRGFRWVTLGSLVAAGTLLFLYLRRLGLAEWLSLLGVAAFGLSAPVGESVRCPFLGEPLTLALTLGFLLAVEAGAGLGVLSLLLVVGSLSKEVFLFYVPLAVLAVRQRRGWREALATGAVLPIPAVVATILLRRWWTPLAASDEGMTAVVADPVALLLILHSWEAWWRPLALGGLLPLALLGCLSPRSRPFLYRSGYLALLFLLLPLAAAVYPGEGRVVHFFAADVPRLLIYALPFLIPLALFGLQGLVPTGKTAPLSRPLPRRADLAAFAAAFLVAAALPLVLDSYRRIDLRGARDGPFILTFCRETLRTARRLDRGEGVAFDLTGPGFVWGEADPGEMARMRWFLREGWGDKPHYAPPGPVRWVGDEASLMVPLLAPRDLVLTLVLEGKLPERVSLATRGRVWTERVSAGPEGSVRFRLPSAFLQGGDNVLILRGGRGAALRSLNIALAVATGRAEGTPPRSLVAHPVFFPR